jgi:hypothetical protein
MGAVDVTDAATEMTIWWGCADCTVDVELAGADAAGFLPTCPDCSGPLHELWRWDLRAA